MNNNTVHIFKNSNYNSSSGLNSIERFAYKMIRTVGASLVVAAIVGTWFLYGPVVSQELNYHFGSRNSYSLTGFGQLINNAEADAIKSIQNEANSYGVDSDYSIVIPKLNAYSNIIANVNPASKDDYMEALSRGVAHAKGTSFPGQKGKTYLFSHSTDSPLNTTRFNAVFYLLRKMEQGDEIIVFFQDQKYVYKVTQRLVVSALDTSILTEESQKETLVLQTCDPPGTTWKRLLVIAEPLHTIN